MSIPFQKTFFFLTVVLLCCATELQSQTLDPARATQWELAGCKGIWNEPVQQIDFITEGGIPDGVTPNDSILSGILTALGSDSAIINFPAGTFFFHHTISLNKKVILRGISPDSSILLFDLLVPGHLISITGSSTSTTTPLTADAAKDSNSIEVANTTLFHKGNYVVLIDNDTILVTSTWAYNTTGQILIVDSVESSRLFFSSPFRRNFSVLRNARITKINPIEHIAIENLKIIRLDSTSQQTDNISFEYAANCRIKCIESFNCNYAHINIGRSTGIEVSGSYFHDAFSYGDGGKAYGVMIENCSGECLVRNNIFDHLRHSMLLQAGANGNVFAYNYSMNPYWTDVSLPANSAGDIVLHGNYPYMNLFEGNIVQNIVIDNSHGINGMYNTFFRNRAELWGLVMNNSPASNDQNYIGNEITNTGFLLGNYLLYGTGHFQHGNNVKGTITPAGTTSLPEASLFLNTPPPYYISTSSWPPIGIPNTLSQYNNKAKVRHLAGVHTECSDTLFLTNQNTIDEANDLIAYPNPVNTELNVSGSGYFYIYDLNGREVLNKKLNESLTKISLQNLESGMYLCKMIDEKGNVLKKKIVKE